MTDSERGPEQSFRVFIVEDRALPLEAIQNDMRNAAQVVALSTWLGVLLLGESQSPDELLEAEAVATMPVGRIRYGSPLEIDFQMVSWAVSWAIAATPTILTLLRGIGQVRLNFAQAGEADANRDLLREQAESTRSERKSREHREKLDTLEDVARDLGPRLDDDQQRAVDYLVNQGRLKPELLQDSIDALFDISTKVLRFQAVSSSTDGEDNLDTFES